MKEAKVMAETLAEGLSGCMTEEKLHEECGVFGIFSPKSYRIASDVYYGLYALQHRGQESCGIVVNDDGLFFSHKDLGQVSTVFDEETLSKLPEGTMAVFFTFIRHNEVSPIEEVIKAINTNIIGISCDAYKQRKQKE